jgi:hypothetical protein
MGLSRRPSLVAFLPSRASLIQGTESLDHSSESLRRSLKRCGLSNKRNSVGSTSRHQGEPAGGMARMLSLGRLSTCMKPSGTLPVIS